MTRKPVSTLTKDAEHEARVAKDQDLQNPDQTLVAKIKIKAGKVTSIKRLKV